MLLQPALYIMIKPPAPVRAACDALRQRAGISRHYDAARLHCTLLHLGPGSDWGAERLAALTAALGRFDGEPFPVRFDWLGPGPRGKAILQGMRGHRSAARFARGLRDHLLRMGAGPSVEQTGFGLHATLAYRGPHPGGAVKPALIEPIGWLAEEFWLIRSLNGQSEHEALGLWRLRQQQFELALEPRVAAAAGMPLSAAA